MNVLELVLGQIPEAIYFALFMIYMKQLKEKRKLFIVLMILEYIIITRLFKFNVWVQILYTFTSYVTLKILYKKKSQIIDVFTFTIGSVILIAVSAACGLLNIVHLFTQVQCCIINRLILFSVLFLLKNKLYKVQEVYKLLWNRNDQVKKKMKSTTFRSINVVIFNAIFYIISIGMILSIIWKGGI